jgi:hypothetical protein
MIPTSLRMAACIIAVFPSASITMSGSAPFRNANFASAVPALFAASMRKAFVSRVSASIFSLSFLLCPCSVAQWHTPALSFEFSCVEKRDKEIKCLHGVHTFKAIQSRSVIITSRLEFFFAQSSGVSC